MNKTVQPSPEPVKKSRRKDHQVPVIDDPTARGFGREFRLSSDEPHVVRVNQKPPKGLPRKLQGFVAVAGTTRPEVVAAVATFIDGGQRRVTLVRDPKNPVDRNAVEVHGRWVDGSGENTGRLGYLPAEVARALAEEHPDSPLGATLEVIYRQRGGKSAGIRIDVWGPRASKEVVVEQGYRADIEIPPDPVDRNELGRRLEKEGLIENAIACYEATVADGFEGSFPYQRLSIIYGRRKDYSREIAALERAVRVFEGLRSGPRMDVEPKLQKFKERLAKARQRAASS